jgi:hypothetical protein
MELFLMGRWTVEYWIGKRAAAIRRTCGYIHHMGALRAFPYRGFIPGYSGDAEI